MNVISIFFIVKANNKGFVKYIVLQNSGRDL